MSDAGISRWATWSEIHAQPAIWRDWAKRFDPAPLRAWVAGAGDVWFCGAGTSAYIGDILAAGLEAGGQRRLRSVPSTDLVARPHAFLEGRAPLVVNFGRSGNSSETVGTLDALAALAPGALQLNITCNADSALATRGGPNARTIVLPEACHDSGFAMTSSFSTMLLTAAAIFDEHGPGMEELAQALEAALPGFADAVGPPPERAVFLGSGAMTFAAREAALKVMELSAGRTACLWDSALGFRHGPKSFVMPGTRIILFTSTEPQARAYEADLADELRQQFPDAVLTVVGPGGDLDPGPDSVPDHWRAPVVIGFAQVAAALWSEAMGLNVDDPFAGQGTLTRVVSGVRLHPVRAS